MASGSSLVKGKSKVGENQFVAWNDIFSFLQLAEMNYSLDKDELKIHPEKDAQVNIPTQMSETQTGDRDEEVTATATASQFLIFSCIILKKSKMLRAQSLV